MNEIRLGRYAMACAMAVVGFGVLASCTSGDAPGGDGAAGSNGGQANGAAGASGNGQLGATAGSTSAGGSGLGTSGSTSSAAGSGSGQAGAVSSVGGAAAGGEQGQSGATSVAGSGAGGSSAGAGGKGGASATGTAGAATGSAGAANTGPQPLPDITGATTGFATRYWDCCKPACTNSNKLSCGKDGKTLDGGGSACVNGSAYMCYSFAPFQDTTNQYVSYAFAASHRACGSCWEVQFTGKAGCSEGAACPATATKLVYNTVFVQVINTGDIANDQFDLLIPGGGVGQFNACSNEWGVSDLGSTYGGFLAGCKGDVSCTQTKCNAVFANKPDLLAGCNWFLNWYGAGDNPQIKFKQVSCPSQLTSKSGMSG